MKNEFAAGDLDGLISNLEAQFGMELAPVGGDSVGESSCCTHSCPC